MGTQGLGRLQLINISLVTAGWSKETTLTVHPAGTAPPVGAVEETEGVSGSRRQCRTLGPRPGSSGSWCRSGWSCLRSLWWPWAGQRPRWCPLASGAPYAPLAAAKDREDVHPYLETGEKLFYPSAAEEKRRSEEEGGGGRRGAGQGGPSELWAGGDVALILRIKMTGQIQSKTKLTSKRCPYRTFSMWMSIWSK